MALEVWQRHVAAALDSFEAGAVGAEELYSRLLTVEAATDASTHGRPALRDLLAAVDEATDLGQDERQRVAWAAAAFWRSATSD